MARFYRQNDFIDPKDGTSEGRIYRVEDVILRDNKLMTRGGTPLLPLSTPTPTPTPPTEPSIEPTPLPLLRPR
jgi:hypothetical protein